MTFRFFNEAVSVQGTETLVKCGLPPNRDGSKGYGGCTYCNNQTFNPEYSYRENGNRTVGRRQAIFLPQNILR